MQLEKFADTKEGFKGLIHPEMIQKEFPNVLNKNGQESTFEVREYSFI